jgi:predicted dehydrogenase
MQNVIMMGLRMLLRAPGMLIGAIIMAFIMNPRLAVIVVIVMPILAVAIGTIMLTAFPRFGIMQKKIDALNETVQENLTNIRVVKSFVREEFEEEKFGNANENLKKAGIGAMGDIGCYSLDMVLNAIGYPKPLTVTGYTSNFFGVDPKNYPWHPEYAEKFEVEDFAAGFIRLEGGIILDFRIAWAMNLDTPGDTIIMGKKASLRIPSTECWNGSVGGPMKVYSEMAGSQVCTEIPLLPDGDCFYHKIRSFLDAILTGGKSPVPTEQIIINQAIIDGIVNSAKQGRELEINIPEV